MMSIYIYTMPYDYIKMKEIKDMFEILRNCPQFFWGVLRGDFMRVWVSK